MATEARTPIRVGIVDDHAILRASLIRYLADCQDLKFVADAGDGNEALKLVQQHRIDVLLLDLRMPRVNGFEAMAGLRKLSPLTRILVFTGLSEDAHAVGLIRRGATGYLSKDCELPEIAVAIRAVAQGHTYLSPKASQLLAQEVVSGKVPAPHENLSTREFQTFIRLARGMSAGAVSEELSLNPKSVSMYRRRALDKLGLRSNSQLTQYAIKHELVE